MKSPFANLDTIQVIGFAISVFVSFVLLSRGQDTLPSISVGLLLAVLTQLFDIQKRISDSEQRLQQASGLSRILYRDEWLFAEVLKIARDYQAIHAGWFDFFKERSKETISTCRNTLDAMAHDHFQDPRGTLYGDLAVKETETKLRNVATEGVGYWQGAHAQNLIDINAATVQKGGTVTRIFVQSRDELRPMMDVLKKQAEQNIEVHIAFRDDLPRDIELEDYIIVDDRVVAHLNFDRHGQVTGQTVSINEVEVGQWITKFERMLHNARPLEKLIADLEETSSGPAEV